MRTEFPKPEVEPTPSEPKIPHPRPEFVPSPETPTPLHPSPEKNPVFPPEIEPGKEV
ncbi:hypothetical protein BH09BAC5_BH09BAC5_28240 [soil metagenome]